jgi:DNA-binding protein H-NS
MRVREGPSPCERHAAKRIFPMRGFSVDLLGQTHGVHSKETPVNFKSMSVEKLSRLKEQVDAALAVKVSEQRRELQAELTKLSRFEGTGSRLKFGTGRGRVAPKYRNPDDPAETWAGRGLRPRWLAAALKSGKKLEDFSIGAPARAAAVKKAPRKMRKAASKR